MRPLTHKGAAQAREWLEHPYTQYLVTELTKEVNMARQRVLNAAARSDIGEIRKASAEYESVLELYKFVSGKRTDADRQLQDNG